MATFQWGNQTWGFGDLPAFEKYLAQHGTTYAKWAANHPDAAQIIESPPTAIDWSAGSNSPSTAPIAGPPGTTFDYNGDPFQGTPTVTDTVGTPPPDAIQNPVAPPPDAPGAPAVFPDNPDDTTKPAIDWAAVLGDYGLPADVAAELDKIFRTTGDINQAIPIAQAYVRGTTWYAQTYPGIQSGINAGLFQDESGYRQYQNQVDQLYAQYYGRAATSAEISQYMSTGKAVTQVANVLQAQAIAGNISDPLKALFTPDEITAFSQEAAGIDTQLGQKITAQANLATQLAPLYQNFYGRAPTRAELDTLVQNGTDAATVAQQFATQENVNAMDPAIKDLFTPAEIQQMALDATGGTTQNGAGLRNLATLATSLNQVYHQYTGAGVSRQEVESAFQTGTTADTVGKQFAGKAFIDANQGDIQQAAGSFGDTGQLTADQLTALGNENAGLDTPQGQAVTAAYQKALTRLHGVFQGVLAHPALSMTGGKLSGNAPPPDIGA